MFPQRKKKRRDNNLTVSIIKKTPQRNLSFIFTEENQLTTNLQLI